MGDVIKATPKKIVICCDGTWQSSVSGKDSLPSNITRIARTIAKAGKDADGKVWQQIVFYDAGVGATTSSKVQATIEGATGDGLVINVLDAYNFVANNYSPGDKIYCFGFSRGAFTARAVAGMITDFGVIKPQYMEYFPSLFAAYQKNLDKHTWRKTKEYFEWWDGELLLVPADKPDQVVQRQWYQEGIRTRAFDGFEYDDSRCVELVGVFDTVGSLGLGDTYLNNNAASRRQYEWLNVKWNPYIKHAFHALALDERRQPFLPTLYYIPDDTAVDIENEALAKDEANWPALKEHRQKIDKEISEQRQKLEKELTQQKCAHNPDLVQVWFTGVHINVGGGREDAKTDFEGLANITFAWMIEQCRPYLAFEGFTNDTIKTYLVQVGAKAAEHDQLESGKPGFVADSLHKISDLLHKHPDEKMIPATNVAMQDYPVIAAAYWAGFRPKDSYSLMYEFISAPANRAPGTSDDRSTETHPSLSKLGVTNEYIHPSVKYRLDSSVGLDEKDYLYKSKPLEDFKYMQTKGVYGWFKNIPERDVWIPEWPILAALESPPKDQNLENSEMALVDQGGDKDEARKFLSDHAAAWKKA